MPCNFSPIASWVGEALKRVSDNPTDDDVIRLIFLALVGPRSRMDVLRKVLSDPSLERESAHLGLGYMRKLGAAICPFGIFPEP